MKIKKFLKSKKGFTLIELLLVIGIISILMGIAIIAINPAAQFAKANNARRWGDVSAIANAISLKIVEDKGLWGLSGNCEDLLAINDGAKKALAADPAPDDPAIVDICDCIVPSYLGSVPLDPSTGVAPTALPCTGYDTKYEISRNAAGRITISATAQAEGGTTPVISVTR